MNSARPMPRNGPRCSSASARLIMSSSLSSAMMSRAGEHINAVSAVIADELGETDAEKWTPVLKRFSEAYHVQFSLFRDDGPQLAGPTLELPQAVRANLLERSPFPPN